MKNTASHRGVPTRFARDMRGAAAVEFAIIALPLMVAIVGIIETGRAFWTWSLIGHETDKVVRQVIVANSATPGTVENNIRTALSQLPQGDLAIDVTVTPAGTGTHSVLNIDISFSFRTALAFVWPMPVELSQRARYPIVSSSSG